MPTTEWSNTAAERLAQYLENPSVTPPKLARDAATMLRAGIREIEKWKILATKDENKDEKE